jgi:hypothetical protein
MRQGELLLFINHDIVSNPLPVKRCGLKVFIASVPPLLRASVRHSVESVFRAFCREVFFVELQVKFDFYWLRLIFLKKMRITVNFWRVMGLQPPAGDYVLIFNTRIMLVDLSIFVRVGYIILANSLSWKLWIGYIELLFSWVKVNYYK